MSDPCSSTNQGNEHRTKPVTFSISFCDGRDDGRTPLINGSREDNIGFEGENEENYFNNKLNKHDLCTSLPAGSPVFGNRLRYVKIYMHKTQICLKSSFKKCYSL